MQSNTTISSGFRVAGLLPLMRGPSVSGGCAAASASGQAIIWANARNTRQDLTHLPDWRISFPALILRIARLNN